jgi:metallo-beta-lactamase class B
MWRSLAILLSTGIFGAQILSAASTPNIPPGMAVPAMQRVSSEVYVAHIAPDLWVHTTIGRLPDGSPYAANGAILEEGDHSILFDVGWTPEQAETLLKWARIKLKHPVTKAYVTHFHNDRVGGIPALERHHIPVFATQATMDLARSSRQPVADNRIDAPSTPTSVEADALIFYPGAGHTKDNVVVYFPHDRVLFGGCLLKAANAAGIGNVADADVVAWPESIKKMQAVFPEAKSVIPGHGPIGEGATQRTLDLLK